MKKMIIISIMSILTFISSATSARIVEGIYADPADFLPYDFSIERASRGYLNQLKDRHEAQKRTVSYQREILRRMKDHNRLEQKRLLLKELNSYRF